MAVFLKVSQISSYTEFNQEEPAANAMKMLGGIAAVFAVTSIANHFLLRRILR